MWILPKNLNLTDPSTSSAFVADTVGSKEDLILLESTIESSLMWRSKASPLRTWLTRWNRVSWMPHLFTRILKPSHHISFEAALTSSLADIRASRLVQREGAGVKMTPAISGHTSENISTQLNLFNASSKTSRDTSRLDSTASSATWKKMVTTQRGEYSQRLKSAHLTRESACSFWPTPVAQDDNKSPEAHMKMKANMKGGPRYKPTSLQVMVKGVEKGLWPTPQAVMPEQTYATWKARMERKTDPKSKNKKVPDNLAIAVKMWPTPTVQDSNKATKKLRDNHQNNLTAIVFNQQLPTPTSRDWKGGYAEKSLTRKDGKSRRFDALPNAAIGGVGTDIVAGHLNPAWIEWLMGVPTGWTELGCWETE